MKTQKNPTFYIVEYRGLVFEVHRYQLKLFDYFIVIVVGSLTKYIRKTTIRLIKKITAKSNDGNLIPFRCGFITDCIEPDQIDEVTNI